MFNSPIPHFYVLYFNVNIPKYTDDTMTVEFWITKKKGNSEEIDDNAVVTTNSSIGPKYFLVHQSVPHALIKPNYLPKR